MRKVLYILGHFNDDDISWMSEVGQKKTVAPGETLIELGVEMDTMYFVTGGTFDVTIPDFGSVAHLQVGEILGEMSFLDSWTPEVTVKALDEGSVFALDFEDLRERFIEEPAFETRLFKAIAQFLSLRLRLTGRRMAHQKNAAEDAPELMDELNQATLERVQIAGQRFSRLLDNIKND